MIFNKTKQRNNNNSKSNFCEWRELKGKTLSSSCNKHNNISSAFYNINNFKLIWKEFFITKNLFVNFMYFIIPYKFLLPLDNVSLIVNVMVAKKTIDSLIPPFSLVFYILVVHFFNILLKLFIIDDLFGDLSVLLSIFFIRFNFVCCFHFSRIRRFTRSSFIYHNINFFRFISIRYFILFCILIQSLHHLWIWIAKTVLQFFIVIAVFILC